jgi:carboxyl-terminal processing protease
MTLVKCLITFVMNKFTFWKRFLLFFITIAAAFQSYSQSEPSAGQKAKRLVKVLESIHYYPTKIDAVKSLQIIEKLMKDLDPKSIYFWDEDKKILLEFSDSLLFDLETYTDRLLDITTAIYTLRLHQSDSIIAETLKRPLDFGSNEVLDISTKTSFAYCNGHDAFRENWERILKARILNELYVRVQDADRQNTSLLSYFHTKEDEIIKRVELISKQRIKKIFDTPEGFDVYIESMFLNSIASVYDPHTNYFSRDKKQEFEESLSSNINGFGISFFDNPNGSIEIDEVTFGSPAWFSNNLEIGDIILSVQPHGKDTIDLTYLDSQELREIIGSNSHTKVTFTVRKPNHKIVVKQLDKTKIESENHARSFVLKGRTTIGYIYLPSFYTNFASRNSTGCALDVMREIIKLQQDSIEGLIVDIRQNGGGAIKESIDLASIFVGEGSFATLKTRNMGNEVLSRSNAGIRYDGPVLVLVDQTSASASELFAGVLQIYNRAVIVGSNTFGKFTGQVILPLNRDMSNLNYSSEENNFGFVKVTTEQTYLSNGISYQSEGIKPDIELPNLLNNYNLRESGLEYSLKSDTIAKDEKFMPLQDLPLPVIFRKSTNRVSENKYFMQISKLEDEYQRIKYMYDKINLQIDSFQTDMQRYNQLLTLANEIKDYRVEVFKAFNNSFDLSAHSKDENKLRINEKIIKAINGDAYIEESYFIMNDLIEIMKMNKIEGEESLRKQLEEEAELLKRRKEKEDSSRFMPK